MSDKRAEKVKIICSDHINNGCRKTCPLSSPCQMQPGDTDEIYAERMNKAAEELEK